MSPANYHPSEAPTVDQVLDTLCHSLRRAIVHYFERLASEPTASLGELVAHLEQRVPDRDCSEISTALVHVHIPKLETRGWLEFERRTETVRYYGHDTAGRLLRQVAEVFS